MKICLACSHGGHLTEMQRLTDAFKGHDVFFITYDSARTKELFPKYTVNDPGFNPLNYLICLPIMFGILVREKPDLIVSTGAEVAIPVFYVARLLGIKTMFIESLCRLNELSATGRIVYPVTDIFLVQWKELLNKCGKKVQYWGNVL
jgi:beta-1,4-N-acetylglucosaminyltransferase